MIAGAIVGFVAALVALLAIAVGVVAFQRREFRRGRAAWLQVNDALWTSRKSADAHLQAVIAENVELRRFAAACQQGQREALLIVREIERLHAQDLLVERTRRVAAPLIQAFPLAGRMN